MPGHSARLKKNWDVIIVGGGIAGYTAAETLAGPEGNTDLSILLVGGEDRLPYKRTKISKHLSSGFSTDEFRLSEHSWYETGNVRLILGNRVTHIDPEKKTVRLETGTTLAYGRLLLAPGSDPVLPELDPAVMGRIRVIRTASQVERLREDLEAAHRVLVIGMGTLGVEVSEQLSLMRKHVILSGRDTLLMGRELSAAASAILANLLRSHGIELKFSTTLRRLVPSAGRLVAELGAEGTVDADLVIFCTGSQPSTALAREAGLRVNRGIVVDARLATSNPDIYAAGDAAEHPGGIVTGLWHAAELQGRIAALNIAGIPATYDQPAFRMKCEIFGDYYFSVQKPVAADYGRYRIVEGTLNRLIRGTLYRCFYYQDGLLQGVVMVNDGGRAKQYEQAVREHWTEDRVNDAFFP